MYVERNDETRRRYAGPHTKIDAVATHHPAQKQVQPFARASRRWPCEETVSACWPALMPIHPRDIQLPRALAEAVEARADVRGVWRIAVEEELLQRSGGLQHLSEDPENRRQIAAAGPAMSKRFQSDGIAFRLEMPNEVRGGRSHHAQQRVNGGQDAGHAAVGQARRAERHDFGVGRVGERANALDGIADAPAPVEFAVESVQRGLEALEL